MGSPNLLFALLIGSVTVSAALKCHYYFKGENRGVVEMDSRDHLCIRITYHCAAFVKPESDWCTTEDITAGRNETLAYPYPRSNYTALIEDSYCSSDPNVRLNAHRLYDVASCDTDLCNDVESSMTIPTCDKPADPKFADFYCNVGTWADDSSINQSTDRAILYPPHDYYCISAHFTDKQTGKADWRAAYMGSSEVKNLGRNSCQDNVFEGDKAIIRSVRVCQWSGCNDGKTGDLVTCQNAIQAAAGEESTRSDGRGLLQLFDRNAARATDDARRVLRVLQSIPSEASGAVTGANPPAAVSEANPPSVPVSSSTVSPSAQDPSTAAGTPSPSVSVSSSTAAPPTHAPQAVPVTKAPVSAAVSAAQISGIFWVPALIAVMALTSNA